MKTVVLSVSDIEGLLLYFVMKSIDKKQNIDLHCSANRKGLAKAIHALIQKKVGK